MMSTFSATSSSRSKPNTAKKRQPVSCEPCRKRRIKCSRTSPPCDTCRRRKCMDSCVYLGEGGESEAGSTQQLLARIDNLEAMLRRHTAASLSSQDHLQSGEYSGQRNANDLYQPSAGLSPVSIVSDHSSQYSTCPPASSTPSAQKEASGDLISNGFGNVQFVPRASQWSAVLANTGIAVPMLDDEHEHEPQDANLGFPFSAKAPPDLEELIAILPPLTQCNYLKDRYLHVFSPLFHILHEPTFHDQYAKFLVEASSVPLSFLAVLFVLLSLAVTSLDGDDAVLNDLIRGSNSPQNIRILSRRYREAAMKCLARQGVFWGTHNVQSLQALIMLGYAMSHSQEKIWVLLGMTYNVAIALACHIDPSKFPLDEIQAEERRRCWAGLMMLYTIQNAFLGNPDPSRALSNSVNLPADVNDADITIDGIRRSSNGPTQMTYLLFKYQLYDITASISSMVLNTETIDPSQVLTLDARIAHMQESWDARYDNDSIDATSPLPAQHKMHIHILHAYAHQLFLLLHRPFFAQSLLGLETPNSSQIRCIASAEALLDIHRLIHSTPEFKPYLWYSNGLGSFHAFHASVVLGVACLMPIYEPQYQKFRRILADTQRRFDQLKDRSVVCSGARNVLRVLLNVPSPNQPGAVSNSAGNAPHPGTDWNEWERHNSSQGTLRFLAERLQAEQWLSPTSLSWQDWNDFLPSNMHMDGILT